MAACNNHHEGNEDDFRRPGGFEQPDEFEFRNADGGVCRSNDANAGCIPAVPEIYYKGDVLAGLKGENENEKRKTKNKKPKLKT